MADVFTPAKRSEVMARIRSSRNKDTELALIAIFRSHRITGWRRRFPLPGRPDFVFPRLRLAVFVDGCFWHGCPKHGRTPQSNVDYWTAKLARNGARDREVSLQLRQRGWRVVRLWEHELQNAARCLKRLFVPRTMINSGLSGTTVLATEAVGSQKRLPKRSEAK